MKARLLGLMIFIAFAVLALAGANLTYSSSMSGMQPEGFSEGNLVHMAPCNLMGEAGKCTMTPFEHLKQFQMMTLAVLPISLILVLASIFAVFGGFITFLNDWLNLVSQIKFKIFYQFAENCKQLRNEILRNFRKLHSLVYA